MRRSIGSLAVCVLVCLCFTGAVVLAQFGEGEPPQAQERDGVGKAASVPQAPDDQTLDPLRPRAAPKAAKGKDVRKAAGQKVGAKIIGDENSAMPGAERGPLRVQAIQIQKGRAVARNPQQNRAPLIQQFTNQARPLLRAELIFARRACQLSREELRQVNQDAQKMLDEVVTKLVDAQFQPRPQVQFGQPAQPRAGNNVDAHQLLQDGVASVMKNDLTAAQWSLYETERAKRDENRKSMTIRYFVDAIDRELYLSAEQCEKLESSLKSKWDGSWTLYLENHLYGNRFYPMTIDALITPILTDAQKKVWQGVQKVGVYWGFAGMLGGFANDMDGLEVELGEPVQELPGRNGAFGAANVQMKMAIPPKEVGIKRQGVPAVKSNGTSKKKGAAAAKEAIAIPEKKAETTKD